MTKTKLTGVNLICGTRKFKLDDVRTIKSYADGRLAINGEFVHNDNEVETLETLATLVATGTFTLGDHSDIKDVMLGKVPINEAYFEVVRSDAGAISKVETANPYAGLAGISIGQLFNSDLLKVIMYPIEEPEKDTEDKSEPSSCDCDDTCDTCDCIPGMCNCDAEEACPDWSEPSDAYPEDKPELAPKSKHFDIRISEENCPAVFSHLLKSLVSADEPSEIDINGLKFNLKDSYYEYGTVIELIQKK